MHAGQISCQNSISIISTKKYNLATDTTNPLPEPVCMSWMWTQYHAIQLQVDYFKISLFTKWFHTLSACWSQHPRMPRMHFTHASRSSYVRPRSSSMRLTTNNAHSIHVHLDLSKKVTHSYMYATWCSLKPSNNKQST